MKRTFAFREHDPEIDRHPLYRRRGIPCQMLQMHTVPESYRRSGVYTDEQSKMGKTADEKIRSNANFDL